MFHSGSVDKENGVFVEDHLDGLESMFLVESVVLVQMLRSGSPPSEQDNNRPSLVGRGNFPRLFIGNHSSSGWICCGTVGCGRILHPLDLCSAGRRSSSKHLQAQGGEKTSESSHGGTVHCGTDGWFVRKFLEARRKDEASLTTVPCNRQERCRRRILMGRC
jgi:hypothetical protein